MKFASTTTDPGRGGRAQALKNNKRAEIGSYNTNSVVVTSLYTPAYSKTISGEVKCPYSEDFAQNGIFCTTKKQNVKIHFHRYIFCSKASTSVRSDHPRLSGFDWRENTFKIPPPHNKSLAAKQINQGILF